METISMHELVPMPGNNLGGGVAGRGYAFALWVAVLTIVPAYMQFLP